MAEMMQADSEERDRKSQEVIDAGDVEEETPEKEKADWRANWKR